MSLMALSLPKSSQLPEMKSLSWTKKAANRQTCERSHPRSFSPSLASTDQKNHRLDPQNCEEHCVLSH